MYLNSFYKENFEKPIKYLNKDIVNRNLIMQNVSQIKMKRDNINFYIE